MSLAGAMAMAEMAASATAVAEEKSDPLNDELQAMRSVARTLEKLDPPARTRVVEWVRARFADQGYEQLQGALNRAGASGWNAPR